MRGHGTGRAARCSMGHRLITSCGTTTSTARATPRAILRRTKELCPITARHALEMVLNLLHTPPPVMIISHNAERRIRRTA